MSPLLERQAADVITVDRAGARRVDAFLATVNGLAARLPNVPAVINMCHDRGHFITAFAAVIRAGHCNLLPPNRQPQSIDRLCQLYPDSIIIHDGITELPDRRAVDITSLLANNAGDVDTANPDIPDDQLCAVTFTSGSTGESQPNMKYWRTLRDSSHINRRYMLTDFTAPQAMLATVPGQHMWGLETSILLPMFANVTIHDGQPLFPMDVCNALEQLTQPRVMVTTPAHLRALFNSDLPFPAVQRVLCATAPLDVALASRVEQDMGASLVEIYGCSEGGSLAWRSTATDVAWQPFDAMHFESGDTGCTLKADHLPETVKLQDNFLFDGNGHFTLQGRSGDLVNVAGKRGSLAELNRHLLSIEGVVDGVVFEPDASSANSQQPRLAALVVAPDLTTQSIRSHLVKYVDPVFVPRPILFVSALPRTDSSKLPRQAVLDLFNQVRTARE